MNKLLRAVEDYLDDEREYVRFAEREIQVLEKKARDERRQTQRRMIAALYWRAGMLEDFANEPDGDPYAREHAYALRMHIEAIERAMGPTL